MNKRITPRIIRMIALQAVIVIVAVTAVGAAVMTHGEFKQTASEPKTTASGENGVSKPGHSAAETPTKKTEFNFEYSYAGFSPKVADMNADLSKILLNYENILPDGYRPKLSAVLEGSEITVDYRVAPYYRAMYDAAKEDGITLTPLEGYISVKDSKETFDKLVERLIYEEDLNRKEATVEAAKSISLPGTSDYNAGLAVSICSKSESFEFTDEYEWLSQNAADYGFILRYPKPVKDAENEEHANEPWNYRFVGAAAAREISKKGITLEKYVQG